MNLINELRMLAEDLHVNGYNRYSAAMSKAADELAKWEAVFGHLGGTPDEALWAGIAAGMITPAHIARPTVAEQDQINAESAIRSIYGTPSAPLPNDRCIHPSGPHPQNEFCAWRTPKTEGIPT